MNAGIRRRALLYFAYGGDINDAQIRTRCDAAERMGVARLPGFRLSFHGRSKVWDGGEATLVEGETAETWGVLYRLSPSEFDRLDLWQGVRLDGSGRYFHFPVDVLDQNGMVRDALIYKRAVLGPPTPPSREFLAHVVEGARSCGLPSDYIDRLAATPARPAGFPVPREDRTAQFLIAGLGCAC